VNAEELTAEETKHAVRELRVFAVAMAPDLYRHSQYQRHISGLESTIASLRTQLAEAQKNADAFEMEWDKALIGRAQAEASETALKGALMEARADAHFAADHKGAPEDCQDSASCHRWARALSGEGRP
jgi:predicted RNase H-like nuclease (RuvC/YqgF family)